MSKFGGGVNRQAVRAMVKWKREQQPMTIQKRVAKIRSTFLGYESHGIFTFSLTLDYGNGSMQDAGGYILTAEGEANHFISGVLGACSVRSWEEIPGRTVFAYSDHSKVHALEPLPTEGGVRFAFDKTFSDWT